MEQSRRASQIDGLSSRNERANEEDRAQNLIEHNPGARHGQRLSKDADRARSADRAKILSEPFKTIGHFDGASQC